MAKKTSELARATVTRLAHVKDGIRVEQAAVTSVITMTEDYIKNIFTGALQFTEHRNGTMILKKDVDAYLKSLESNN
jgi:histone H3/H4